MKLIEHRINISKNDNAYTFDVFNDTERLIKSLIPHLKKAKYDNVTFGKHSDILRKIIYKLFETQDFTPIFHVEGTQYPLCWNRPADWDKNYIKYEWGHIHSINQNEDKAFDIKNLGLYSARCNQHIQSSMDVQELMVYGGILSYRITNVLTKRRFLFATKEWEDLENRLKE